MRYLQRYKIIIAVTAIFAMIFPLTALADDAASAKPAKPAEPAKPAKVAVVNGKAIAYKDFERKLMIFKQQLMRGQPGQLPDALQDRIKTQAVNQLIAEELLYQEGVKLKLKLEDGFVGKELQTLKDRFDSEGQYRQTLEKMGLTEDQLKHQISRQALIRMLVENEVISKIELAKEDAKKYFQSNMAEFHQPERVRAQHILVKVAPGDDEQKKAEARKKLEDVKKRILAGEDFGRLAKQYSEGPSNVREGDLGYFTRGRMVKSFEEAAFKLAPNEISDIVETQFGYHLIKVLDHQVAKDPTFEEIESRVMAVLRNKKIRQKYEAYVYKLRQNAKIETFLN